MVVRLASIEELSASSEDTGSEKSGDDKAGSSSKPTGGTTSPPLVPNSNALSLLQQLIKLVTVALEVRKVDDQGQEIAADERWAWLNSNVSGSWSWSRFSNNYQEFPNTSYLPLRDAIRGIWDQLSFTDMELDAVRRGLSWATCVGNQEFLKLWDELIRELRTSDVDRFRIFGLEVLEFIYNDRQDSHLSPLHYAVFRKSASFQDTLLRLLSCASDKDKYFSYLRWAPSFGLAFDCAADNIFVAKHSREDSPLMYSFLSKVNDTLESLSNGEVLWEGRNCLPIYPVGYNFAPLTWLHHLCLDLRGKLTEPSSETIAREWLRMPSRIHGLTPLHMAVITGTKTGVRALLKLHKLLQVNINALDCGKRSALHWALYGKHEEIVRALVDHAMKNNQPLNAADEDCDNTTPMETALDWDSSSNKEIADLLLKAPDVDRQIDKQYRDRQVYVDAANAKLVGAALIASITFAGWLQPPLGFVQYDQYPVGGSNQNNYRSFAALEQEFRVRLFWVFNSLSFYFAVATVLSGAGSALPRSDIFITAAVRSLNRWLIATSGLLTVSIMCGLGAFTAAGFAILPPILSLEMYMIVPAVLGLLVCFTVMLCYVAGIMKILLVRVTNNKRRKARSGCGRDVIEYHVEKWGINSSKQLERLELVRRIVALERLEYLHSVAVAIERELNKELENPSVNMEEVDKKFNAEVDARLKSCVADEDVSCKFIKVKKGVLLYDPVLDDDRATHVFGQKRKQLGSRIDAFAEQLEKKYPFIWEGIEISRGPNKPLRFSYTPPLWKVRTRPRA